MKIGIMTMHRIPNYGSFIQALSLKRMIEELGHQVCFVDYHVQPAVEKKHDPKETVICWIKNKKRIIKGTFVGKTIGKFLGTKAELPEIWYTRNELLGLTDSYVYRKKVDVLIIGSDEVFNCLQSGYNVGYSRELFGKNNRAKKVITYAASFGSTNLCQLQQYGVDQEIAVLLSKMDDISVRDENTQSIVYSLSGVMPQLHLDPVLVGNVEKEEWEMPALSDYVILYGYHQRFTEQECRHIMEFAHKRGKTVIALGEDQVIRDQHILCRPDAVLGYFAKADYVFTDTFHGTIFSVITHKPFLTVARPGRMGNNEKISSLANKLGITDRIVQSFEKSDERMLAPIDFAAMDILRSEERKRALHYLSNHLV